MHPQLEQLLELQDLKAQKVEMDEVAEASSRQIERDVFQVQPDDAAAKLQAKIKEMEAALEAEIAKRYRLISGRRSRAVVPVIDGVCYGCFIELPTSVASHNEAIRWCENCGSFIYFVD